MKDDFPENNAIRDFESVKGIIENGRKFLLTTHVHPDGDGLGSELALYHYLKSIGKEPHIINASRVPKNYRFLCADSEISLFDDSTHESVISEMDAAFVLDIGDYARLRKVGEVIRKYGIKTVCIDHHPREKDNFDYYFIDTEASATGELIYDILKKLNAEFTPEIAENLYTAIVTDTGSFRFSNTTGKAHSIVAEMIEKGVRPEKINFEVYEQNTHERIKLISAVLTDLHYSRDGRFVWAAVSRKLLTETGAKPADLEGVTDMMRGIKGVIVSLLALELKDSVTKFSFRSKKGFESGAVARKFGGGGHRYASGAVIEKPLADSARDAVKEIESALEKFSAVTENREDGE